MKYYKTSLLSFLFSINLFSCTCNKKIPFKHSSNNYKKVILKKLEKIEKQHNNLNHLHQADLNGLAKEKQLEDAKKYLESAFQRLATTFDLQLFKDDIKNILNSLPKTNAIEEIKNKVDGIDLSNLAKLKDLATLKNDIIQALQNIEQTQLKKTNLDDIKNILNSLPKTNAIEEIKNKIDGIDLSNLAKTKDLATLKNDIIQALQNIEQTQLKKADLNNIKNELIPLKKDLQNMKSDLETKVDKVDTNVNVLEKKINEVDTKVDFVIQELNNIKNTQLKPADLNQAIENINKNINIQINQEKNDSNKKLNDILGMLNKLNQNTDVVEKINRNHNNILSKMFNDKVHKDDIQKCINKLKSDKQALQNISRKDNSSIKKNAILLKTCELYLQEGFNTLSIGNNKSLKWNDIYIEINNTAALLLNCTTNTNLIYEIETKKIEKIIREEEEKKNEKRNELIQDILKKK